MSYESDLISIYMSGLFQESALSFVLLFFLLNGTIDGADSQLYDSELIDRFLQWK